LQSRKEGAQRTQRKTKFTKIFLRPQRIFASEGSEAKLASARIYFQKLAVVGVQQPNEIIIPFQCWRVRQY
jgi:hypothetical protein